MSIIFTGLDHWPLVKVVTGYSIYQASASNTSTKIKTPYLKDVFEKDWGHLKINL